MKVISTPDAPQAIGPYAQAVKAGDTIYCSGQIPIDATNGELVNGGIAAQTRCVLANLSAVLTAAGSSLSQVVKTTVYLADMQDFPAMNAVYAEAFGAHTPARATVEVARLPKDVRVEIDCVGTTV